MNSFPSHSKVIEREPEKERRPMSQVEPWQVEGNTTAVLHLPLFFSSFAFFVLTVGLPG